MRDSPIQGVEALSLQGIQEYKKTLNLNFEGAQRLMDEFFASN